MGQFDGKVFSTSVKRSFYCVIERVTSAMAMNLIIFIARNPGLIKFITKRI